MPVTRTQLRRTRALVAAIVVAAIVGLGGGAHADRKEDDLRARTHFAAGEYKQALDIYARLYAETLHPTYLRNIARCHQNLGDPDKAIGSFREYLRKAKELSPDQRKEIEGYIAEMEELKRSRAAPEPKPAAPEPKPSSPTAPAPVTPSAAAPPTEMPAPTLTVPPPPAESSLPLVGAGGPAATVERSQPSDDAPVYTRWWLWAAVGGVVAAGIVTALLLGRDTSPTHGSLGALDLKDKN